MAWIDDEVEWHMGIQMVMSAWYMVESQETKIRYDPKHNES